MQIVMMTDIGNVRTVNQDYVRCFQKSESEYLIVLCDGMGGHKAGEVAAQMTADDIIERYKNYGQFQDEDAVHIWMVEMINHAHELVKTKSHVSEEWEGMGTTVVLALIKDKQLYISHVGDSRAYMYQDEKLVQLTKDDTLVNVLVDAGTISKDEAETHPQKNVLLQAVGVSSLLNISFLSYALNDELILMCTDGLYNSLTEGQLIEILKQKINLDDMGKALMNAANTFGGNDNIGFALVSGKGVEENESNQ